jgi:hypothetical protein
MTLAEQINNFNRSLEFDRVLPDGISVMNPFQDPVVFGLSKAFYDHYFSDREKRVLILGINPGRLGGGVTGIPFTDPVKLKDICGISNEMKRVTEPSSRFIYDMIDAFGGPSVFYSRFLIQAVCPLGFLKEGTNYNYYDDKQLQRVVYPFILKSLKIIYSFYIDTSVCYCLGMGKNFRFLQQLNENEHLFRKVIPLPHPRWIVQYRRRQYEEFIQLYLKALS